MEIIYDNLDFDDLQGDLIADYLIAVDADLKIIDAGRTIYEEPFFPVLELARALVAWSAATARGDFELDSLSTDVRGIVTIAREGDGWTVFSAHSPDVRTVPVDESEIDACVERFIGAIRADLRRRGVDSDRILGEGDFGSDGPQ